MESKWTYCFLISFIVFFFNHKARAQVLTSDEIENAMESPQVKSSFHKCLAGKFHSDVIRFTMAITKDGKVILQSTNPELDPETLKCLQSASKGIKLTEGNKSWKLIYRMSFSEKAGKEGSAATSKSPNVVYLPTSPEDSTNSWPIVYKQKEKRIDSKAIKMKRQGRDMVISGAVLLPTGVALSCAMIALMIIPMHWRGSICEGDDCWPDYNNPRDNAIGSIAIVSIVMTVTGIFLVGFGARKKRVAEKYLRGELSGFIPELGVALSPPLDGAAAALIWHF